MEENHLHQDCGGLFEHFADAFDEATHFWDFYSVFPIKKYQTIDFKREIHHTLRKYESVYDVSIRGH